MKSLIIILVFLSSLSSHELILNVKNNNNNTITIQGKFSTDEHASGAIVRLESLFDAKILYEKRLPKSSELTLEIPKVPYQIVLDGSPDEDIIVKEGIAPLEGFNSIEKKESENVNNNLSVNQSNSEEWNDISILFFIICLILLLLAIYFSNKNTNKILNEIRVK